MKAIINLSKLHTIIDELEEWVGVMTAKKKMQKSLEKKLIKFMDALDDVCALAEPIVSDKEEKIRLLHISEIVQLGREKKPEVQP